MRNEARQQRTGTITDRTIWRAAHLLIGEQGEDAEIVATERADDMAERGDHEERSVWLRIRRAFVEM